jgi:hypothetical protein
MGLHEVRYSNDAYLNLHSEMFRTQKDAVEFIERLPKAYRYVWLSETGEYKTPGGKWVSDWICYWWSPPVAATDWGPCPDSGWGYPGCPPRRRFLVPYRPRLYNSPRHAHLNVRASPVRPEAPTEKHQSVIADHGFLASAVRPDAEDDE